MNPYCDGINCTKVNGTIKIVSLETDSNDNMLLCHDCYIIEMFYRLERNKDLKAGRRFVIPLWENLQGYNVHD